MQKIYSLATSFCTTKATPGKTITVPFTSCLTGLNQSVQQIKTKIVICHTADSNPLKQEVNGTMILPPLVFPDKTITIIIMTIVSDATIWSITYDRN